jgi:hypothetical protein
VIWQAADGSDEAPTGRPRSIYKKIEFQFAIAVEMTRRVEPGLVLNGGPFLYTKQTTTTRTKTYLPRCDNIATHDMILR